MESVEDDVTDDEMLIDLIQMIREVFDQEGLPCPPGISVECGMDNGVLVTASHPCLSVLLRSTLHSPCTLIIHTGTLLSPADGWSTSHGLWYKRAEAPF